MNPIPHDSSIVPADEQGTPVSGHDIFDPASYASVRRPLEHASHLPARCYTSQAFYDREVERILMRSWNFVGRAERIPEPGDYFTVDLAGVPAIVVRGGDARLRAFVNSCRHRGARLVSGDGRCGRAIACRYHGWTYDLDGRLIATPGMDGVAGFDSAEYGLQPIRLECWDGFVFINFDPEAAGLEAQLGELPARMSSYSLADMVCTRRREYDVGCNWKLLVENAMEEYHTATVHRGSIGSQSLTFENGGGEWEAGHLLSEGSVAMLPGEGGGFAHIPTLEGLAAKGTYFVLVYPCTVFALNQDCIMWLELYPQRPDRTRVIVGSAFPKATTARPDFETEVEKYYHRWDTSIPEDNWISEQQQLGLSSPLSVTGRVSRLEPLVHEIANWVLDRVLDVPDPGAARAARRATAKDRATSASAGNDREKT